MEVSEQGDLRDDEEMWNEGWREIRVEATEVVDERDTGDAAEYRRVERVARSQRVSSEENEGRRHSTAQYKELKKTIDRCRTARAQGKPIEITECFGRKREDDAACLLLCCREKHRWGRRGGRVQRGELRESEREKKMARLID